MASRNRRIKLGVTKADVHSYDELMEGGIFLMEVHIVKKGETLWKIARHYGISFEELKRVNAHLANPDYIVPGMKIFLPAKTIKTEKEGTQTPHKGAGGVKKTEKEPVHHKPTHETPKAPAHHKPTHEVPKAPVHHKPTHEVPKAPAHHKPTHEKPKAPTHHKPTHEKPKAPVIPVVPVPPTAPQMPQIPPMHHPMPPMQPMQPQMPFVGIPCGWMPIFDADCFPFVQPGHMQQAIPMPTPQLPVELESSMHINVRPMPLPAENTMPDGWKLLESPELQFEEVVTFEKPPEIHFEESPCLKVEERIEEIPIPSPPQFQMPIAQESPMQGGWQFGQHGGYAAHPQAWCGCGQGQAQPYPQMNPCGGCGQHHPMPLPMRQPVHHSNHCNACNQPIQAMPGQMMPYPTQHSNWPGNY